MDSFSHVLAIAVALLSFLIVESEYCLFFNGYLSN